MPRLVLISFPGYPELHWGLLAAAANCHISKQQLMTKCHWEYGEPWMLALSLVGLLGKKYQVIHQLHSRQLQE